MLVHTFRITVAKAMQMRISRGSLSFALREAARKEAQAKLKTDEELYASEVRLAPAAVETGIWVDSETSSLSDSGEFVVDVSDE